jgi:hypothetical protein
MRRITSSSAAWSIGAGAHTIGVFLAAKSRRSEAVADLDTFYRVNAHAGTGELRVELHVEGRTPACRNAGRHAFDDGTERGAGLARRVDEDFPARSGGGIGAEERVVGDFARVEAFHAVATDLDDMRDDADFADYQPRDSARRDPRCGFAGRTAPAAAIVAQAVFRVIGIVGVAGTIGGGDLIIVFRTLVDVLDHQADRRAGRPSLEHARQDAHRIGFLPLSREFRRARTTLVEKWLDIGFAQRQPRRTAVNHGAERRPVRFAPGRKTEKMAEAVVAHESVMSGASSAFMPTT